MPAVDINVLIVWNQQGVPMVNTAVARYDDASNDPQSVADSIRDNLVGNILTNLSNSLVLEEVKVGDDVSGAVAVSGQENTGGSDPAPPNTCFGITKVVNSGRNGRFFLPGVTEVDVDGSGKISSAKVNQLNAAFAAFLTACETDGVDLRVAQKIPLDPAQIDTFSVRPFVSRQGRRLDRARGFSS